MEVSTVEELFGIEKLMHLKLESWEKFLEVFFYEVEKEKKTLEINVALNTLKRRIRKMDDLYTKLEQFFNFEEDSSIDQIICAQVINFKLGRSFEFECKAKIPLLPGGLIDALHQESLKQSMVHFISYEMLVVRTILAVLNDREEFSRRILCRPSLISKMFT